MRLSEYLRTTPRWERLLNQYASALEQYKQAYASLPAEKRTVFWMDNLR